MNKGGIVFIASVAFLAAAACSSTNTTPVPDAGKTTATCGSKSTVEDMGEKDCAGCTAAGSCTSSAPLEACCNWVPQPTSALARSTTLHRFSAPNNASSAPDLSCLTSPGMLGTSRMVTLTGYVWLFSSGTDSSGVKVDVYTENNPNTDGSISPTPLGSYTTSTTDPADPVDTTWNTHGCPSGCSYRQYTIANVPTETPLVLKTSDATGGTTWATLYDYNIYFPNSAVEDEGGTPTVHYDATVAASNDPNTVAGSVGLTVTGGVIAGEVHDCWDDPQGLLTGVRLSGATVATSEPSVQIYYSTSDESNPLLDQSANSTSPLSLFAGINFETGKPVRVTAVGQDPANPGKYLLLGTYVVQTFPSAVTAISLRGRRPWQL
jgi:hypothetical protein